MLFMPHLHQVWFVKLLIEWYWVDGLFLEQRVFKVVLCENTEPQMVRDQKKFGNRCVNISPELSNQRLVGT